jgi:excisionase family DNA binding protein
VEYSITQAASLAKTDRGTIWRHIANSNLKARRVGKVWIIRIADLQDFINDRERSKYR